MYGINIDKKIAKEGYRYSNESDNTIVKMLFYFTMNSIKRRRI